MLTESTFLDLSVSMSEVGGRMNKFLTFVEYLNICQALLEVLCIKLFNP